MATLTSTLKLYDSFSNTMNQAGKSVDKMLEKLNRLKSTNNIIVNVQVRITGAQAQINSIKSQLQAQLSNANLHLNLHLNASFNTMLTAVQKTLTQIRIIASRLYALSQNGGGGGGGNGGNNHAALLARIQQLQAQINQLQAQINSNTNRTGKSTADWVSKLATAATAYFGIQKAQELYMRSLEGAIKQIQYLSTFQIRSGSEQLGSAIYENIVDSAIKAGQDVDAALSATNSYLANTVDPKELVELNKLAARLEKLSPEQGTAGAAFAIKEYMSGDYVSLVERFEISRAMLKNADARKAGMAGDVQGFIKGFDEILNKLNITQKQMDKLAETPLAKWKRAVSSFNYALSKVGQAAFLAFEPLFDKINEGFQDGGNFERIFGSLEQGFYLISKVAATVIGWLIEHWDLVKNTLLAVGIVASAVAVAFAIDWLMAVWPLVLIVAAIALVTTALNKFGVDTGTQVSVVAGYFYGLLTYIRNQFAILWDVLISFATFFANLFIDPKYAVQKLFYDLFMDLTGYFENAINQWSDGINKFIGTINEATGLNITGTGHVDLSANYAPPSSSKDTVDLSYLKMGQKNVIEAYDQAANATQALADAASDFSLIDEAKKLYDPSKVPKSAKTPADDDKKKKKNIGTVDKVKKVVDVSSEDLKLMRELAEMKSIQNFVTLTPTVQMNTGDINSGADLDSIVGQISDKLEEQFVSTAEGVYE